MNIGWIIGTGPNNDKAVAWNVETGEYQLCQGTAGPTVSDLRLDPLPFRQDNNYGSSPSWMALWLKWAQRLEELQNRYPRPQPPVQLPTNPQPPNRMNGPVGQMRVSAEGATPPGYLTASGSGSGSGGGSGSATYTKTSGEDWTVAHKVGDGNWVLVFGDGGSTPMNAAVTFAQKYGDGLRGASTYTFNNDGATPVFPYPAFGVMGGINFTVGQTDPNQANWNNLSWSQV